MIDEPVAPTYKASIEERLRAMEREIEKCKLREQQFIILLKTILNKAHNRIKTKKRLNMQELIAFFENTILAVDEPDTHIQNDVDLISNLVKRAERKQ